MRLDGHVAIRTVLRPELHIQQPQEVVDLGQGRDRALAAAATRSLFDRYRGRNSEYRIDIRSRGRLNELTRVRVERFEVTALPFIEENVEGERRFTRAGYPGDDRKPVARNLHVDVLEIVLASVVNHDGVVLARHGAAVHGGRLLDAREGGGRAIQRFGGRFVTGERLLILRKRLTRIGPRIGANFRRRPGADHFTAALPAIGPQVHNPVARADHVEIVFDHQQRMPGDEELAEGFEELGNIVEVQAGGRFIEQEQLAVMRGA